MIDGGLRILFRKHLPQFDWCSIESGGTGRGIPDSNFCCAGIEGFIEFKQTTGWAVTLRPEQTGWILRRVRHGGRVFIAVRRQNAGGARLGSPVDELWLFPGCWAARAKELGLRGTWTTEAMVQHNGPTAWDWRAISNRLLG